MNIKINSIFSFYLVLTLGFNYFVYATDQMAKSRIKNEAELEKEIEEEFFDESELEINHLKKNSKNSMKDLNDSSLTNDIEENLQENQKTKTISSSNISVSPIKIKKRSDIAPNHINIHINAGSGSANSLADQTAYSSTTVNSSLSKDKITPRELRSEYENSYDDDVELNVRSIKDSRKKLEKYNEIKVVETLENSRLEDERKRSETIAKGFLKINSESNKNENKNEELLSPSSQVLTNDFKGKEVFKEEIKKEIIQDLSYQTSDIESSEYDSNSAEAKMGIVLGLGDYPGVSNVRGEYAIGIHFAKEIKPFFDTEGAFSFSEFSVEQKDGGWYFDPYYGWFRYPRITKMNQYQGSFAAKYVPFRGTFEPYLGGVIAYTYRTFSDVQFAIPNNDAQSHAVDMGLVTGVKMALSKDVTVGFDFRYFSNIFHRAVNSGLQRNFSQSVYRSDKAIESFSYTHMGLVGEFRF